MSKDKLTIQDLLQDITTDVKSQEQLEAESLIASLPTDLQDKYISSVEDNPSLKIDLDFTSKWCLCEMPEGGYPRVFLFNELAVLLDAIIKREGTDTAVWITYGTAFQLTRSVTKPNGNKVRYLLLPDDKAIKLDAEQQPTVIDSSLLPEDLETQDDGWLGENNTLADYFVEGITKTEDDLDEGLNEEEDK